jgi:hypothetical protein
LLLQSSQLSKLKQNFRTKTKEMMENIYQGVRQHLCNQSCNLSRILIPQGIHNVGAKDVSASQRFAKLHRPIRRVPNVARRDASPSSVNVIDNEIKELVGKHQIIVSVSAKTFSSRQKRPNKRKNKQTKLFNKVDTNLSQSDASATYASPARQLGQRSGAELVALLTRCTTLANTRFPPLCFPQTRFSQ